MLKIGKFAKFCGVTRQTLRHWEDIGLLHPAWTDPDNLYRYYSRMQIDDVAEIIALQQLGLRLRDIGLVRAQEIALEAALRQRLSQLELTLSRQQTQAARIREILEEGRITDTVAAG